MECLNPHCKNTVFFAVIETDDTRIVGVKCASCGARYTAKELKIEANRKGFWNSVIWDVTHM